MNNAKYQPISPPVKAVFLDFGDTLVETKPLYVERLRISFEKLGLKRSYEDMERAYVEADWRAAVVLLERTPFPQDAWRGLFAAIMIETLNIKQNVREFMKQVSEQMTLIRPERRLVPGAGKFLEFCKIKNIRLAVLSNNDGRTREKCREVGIEEYFDIIMDSTLEGIMKPNPDFFTRALDYMKVYAADVLHVGDLLGCDVLGARKVGIRVAWFNQRQYTPRDYKIADPDYTVHNLKEIETLLGST
jgi:HAD superfamily hydrolase (TIGR01549 family)